MTNWLPEEFPNSWEALSRAAVSVFCFILKGNKQRIFNITTLKDPNPSEIKNIILFFVARNLFSRNNSCKQEP